MVRNMIMMEKPMVPWAVFLWRTTAVAGSWIFDMFISHFTVSAIQSKELYSFYK